jgi:NAD-dependent DNA ligase
MRSLFPSTKAVEAIEEAAYTKADAKKDYTRWNVANTAYHNGASIMSDAEFDRLTKKLKPFYPDIEKQVGAAPKVKHASARKVRHETPMSSLDKAYAKDLTNRVKAKIGSASEAIVSEKVDGFSLQYRCNAKGVKQLVTRGKDGVGVDVSHLIEPLTKYKLLGRIANGEVIRFELVMPRGSLKDMEDEGDPEVERNAIASIVNSSAPNLKVLKRAMAIALSYMVPALAPERAFKKLKSAGWHVPVHQKFSIADLTEKKLTAIYNSWSSKSRYAIDGIVVAANVAEEPKLSNPKRAFAFKVNTAGIKTEVVSVDWQVSRYGQLKPVAIIKPVKIDGVTVTKATAHNAKYVKVNKLGPGAEVEIIRSGGVIPYIVEVTRKAAMASFPKAKTYQWDANKVNITTLQEDHASESNAKQLQIFFNKIGVTGFGPAIATLVAEKSIPEVISMDYDDWLDRGAGNSAAQKIPDGIRKALQSAAIPKLMAYSGVFGQGFGESSARDLWDVMTNQKPKNVRELRAELASLAGWSDTSAADVAGRWKAWVNWFNSLPVKPAKKTKKATVKGPLTGAVIVFTKVRDKEMERAIEAKGGTIAGSVTKATTHVIYADGETSTKMDKAKASGVKLVPYSKARAKLNL